MKIPVWLTKPRVSWTEKYGVQRAVATLKAEAAIRRKEGDGAFAAVLSSVARALQQSETTPEAVTLDWVARLSEIDALEQEKPHDQG